MKKKIILLLLAIIMPFYINAEEVEDTNAIYGLTSTTVSSSITGKSEFSAGTKVEENKSVDGIFFVVGNEVTVDGQSEYGVYAGNNVKINSTIEKDLFLAGNIIKLNAYVQRDSYIAGSIIDLSGTYNGNMYLAGDTITLENVTINGDLNLYCSTLTIKENVVINNIRYNENSNVSNLDKAIITNIETYKDEEKEEESTTTLLNTILNFIRTTLSLLVVAYLINFAFPSIYEKLNKKINVNYVLKTSSVGLALLFLIPIIALITMFTVITLPASLLVLIIYSISLYLSKLIIISVIGNIIYTKVLKNKKDKPYLSILIGVVLYKLLILIPYLGTIVKIIAIIYGLGYLKEMLFSNKK